MAVSRRPDRYSKRGRSRAAARSRSAAGRSKPKTSAPRKGFILTVVDGPQLGKEFFFETSASIGRVESNDIVLIEPGISRSHARLYEEAGAYMLEDSGSANGTRLNGELITEAEVLRDGDYITLSGCTLQFSQLDAARGDITAQTSLSDVEASAADARSRSLEVGEETPRGVRGLLRTRRRKLLAVAGVLLLLGGGAYLANRGGGKIVQRDLSKQPLAYSDEDAFFEKVLGYGKYDQSHKYQAVITFEYLGGRATLQYGAWGVDKVGEVEILLNGEKVDQAPVTMDRWIYGLKVLLPRDRLKKGTNEITFRNTRNPPNNDMWEICYVQVIQEAIPPPDPAEARREFELAKKAWEDRDIEPSNMSRALVGFKRARDLLEKLPDKPPLYQDAVDYINKVDKELTRRFSDGWFSARRAEKLDRDIAKARSLLLQTRRYFHKDDFRYREIERYLDALAMY
jgi:pSer/pThr/pTyr-binding forkhead associated (FHA) protein